MHKGGCLCGGVEFAIHGELAPIQICHCSQCRKAQGTPFATNIPVRVADFDLRCGRELLCEYASSPGKQRAFCGRCGSPVYSRRDSDPRWVRIRAGLLEGPLAVTPAFHFHVASRCDWWQIHDDLPQFPEARPER